MKTRFFVLSVIMIAFMPLAARCQAVFPLPELQKMVGKNASDFETLMLEKDYSIQTKQSNPTTKVYSSDKPGAQNKQYTVVRHQVPNANVNLTFTTTDKKWYLELKSTMASTGYKFVNEETKTVNGVSTTVHNFSNKTFTVSVCTYTSDVAWFQAQIHI